MNMLSRLLNPPGTMVGLGVRSGWTLLMLGLLPGHVSADIHLFRVDPASTSLSLQGSTTDTLWQEQGPAGLTTTFQGWLVVDLQASSIQIVGGSSLLAGQTNSWQPGLDGSVTAAPADYGAKATIGKGITAINQTVALRNLVFELTSPPLPTGNGPINTSSVTLSIPSAGYSALDYRANGPLVLGGNLPLGGLTATNAGGGATLSILTEVQTLSIPLDLSFTNLRLPSGDTTLRFTGVVVARRGLTIVNRQLLWFPSATNNSAFTLIWDTTLNLQMTPTLSPPNWTDFATEAPVTVSTTAPSAFFRVGGP
jgi:hypothetical protein